MMYNCLHYLISKLLLRIKIMVKNLYILILMFVIASCSNNKIVSNPITNKSTTPGLFSKDSEKGISLSNILDPKLDPPSGSNVNGFLWRASLNVLSVVPLISTDAFGGTIITDWYVKKNIKDKRIKITAYIKTSDLRSDGIEVKVHVQKLVDNIWSDTFKNDDLAYKIENNILNEARNLRIKAFK